MNEMDGTVLSTSVLHPKLRDPDDGPPSWTRTRKVRCTSRVGANTKSRVQLKRHPVARASCRAIDTFIYCISFLLPTKSTPR